MKHGRSSGLPERARAVPSTSTPRVGTVLLVHQSADLYGSDRMLLATADAVRAAGGLPIVALPGDGPLAEALRARAVEVHTLSDLALLKLSRAVMSLKGALALASYLHRSVSMLDACVAGRRIDLVLSNTLAVLGGAWWAWRRRVPHLWHVHEIVARPRWAALAFPWLVAQAGGAVLCNSQATQRWLVAARPGLAARSGVVWNGVADPRAHVQPAEVARWHERFRPAGATVAIGLVGRVNRMKGHALLLQAAERLHARGHTQFSLVFVGSPAAGQDEHLVRLRQAIAASPLRQRVHLQGFVADPAPAFAALDIVCVPSTEVEAFGLVAVEAMAVGRPVVAAEIGGLPEVVEHGVTGLLHRAGDVQALVDALEPLLRIAHLRTTMGTAGRLRYESEFTVRQMQERMLWAMVAAQQERLA